MDFLSQSDSHQNKGDGNSENDNHDDDYDNISDNQNDDNYNDGDDDSWLKWQQIRGQCNDVEDDGNKIYVDYGDDRYDSNGDVDNSKNADVGDDYDLLFSLLLLWKHEKIFEELIITSFF